MKIARTAFLITILLHPTHGFGPREATLHDRVAFAGGFGSSSSTKKGKKTKKKKRKGSILADDDIQSSASTTTIKTNDNDGPVEPELDRFGLPIRTAENFFPPLSSGTELIGLDYGEGQVDDPYPSLEVVQSCMEGYIPLNYEIFDESGVEKEHLLDDGEDPSPPPWKLNLLHKSPPVIEVENFFTEEECLQYMGLAKDVSGGGNKNNQPSGANADDALKVDSATFSSLALSKRTSTTWFCHFSQVPTLLAKARRLLNDLPLEQMEEAQIVRYRTGEEFSWHYDEIPTAQLDNGGQRIATLLVYLNTIQEGGGGGTIFRDLKNVMGGELTMQPKMGSALLFFPALLNGEPDDRTLHKGEVAVEEKMIAQMWIHERKYTPVIPEGNSHEAAVDFIHAKEIELGYKSD